MTSHLKLTATKHGFKEETDGAEELSENVEKVDGSDFASNKVQGFWSTKQTTFHGRVS